MELDIQTIVAQSLRDFLRRVRDTGWRGRENEAVNLYALGFLLRGGYRATQLKPTQIGIEVAVANTAKKGKKAQVRKDLVIWPEPGMNRWHPGGSPENRPIAILEWKVRRPGVRKPVGATHDLDWLRSYSRKSARPDFVGYCVYLDLTTTPAMITVRRVAKGRDEVFPVSG